MEQTRYQQFRASLTVQIRVIKALIRREYITLSGKSGFGFVLLFGEPFIVMLFVMGIVAHSKMHSKMSFPVYDFVVSGWGILWLCRYPLQRMGGVIIGNASFLYHRNIKIFDILIARTILMLSASLMSFVLIFIGYILIVPTLEIYNFSYILISLFFTCWYTISICLLTGMLTGYCFLAEKVAPLVALVHVFISGSFFMVSWLPKSYQKIALLSPLIDATEMMRYGFYGDKVLCLFDIPYTIAFNLFLTFFTLRLTYVMTKTRNLILE